MISIGLLREFHLNILYEKCGGYRKFNSIVERTAIKKCSTSPDFISYALFQSLAMSDCIRVTLKNGSFEWSLNLPKISTKENNKNFLFADELISSKTVYEKVLFHNEPLVYSENFVNDFISSDSILNKIIPFRMIVDKSVELTESRINKIISGCELFCFDRNSWIVVDEPVMQSSFYRVKGAFTGVSYYVYINEVKLTYRILNPEWAMIIASFLLNRSFNKIFIKSGKDLKIKNFTKIPYAILQYLFLNSDLVLIENGYEFKNINEVAMDGLFEYLLSR